jgi:acrylyl-CoA reductase (NADPH)
MTRPDTFRGLVAERTGDGARPAVLALDELPDADVLIAVEYSSINYKDALAASPNGRVARISPLVPGIDLAGVVVESSDPRFAAGERCLAHGYDIGSGWHGGYAEYARLPADWIVALPRELSARDAMAIGTAGFTAAQSVAALEASGLSADDGPVLVLGASGGVGSVAVALLAERGYEIVASTGKTHAHALLRQLGAAEILDRGETGSDEARPLESERWAGCVDPVGGQSLAYALRTLRYGRTVATSGMTAGVEVRTTVLPFILRGVSLVGIDSVQVAIEARRALWGRLATDLRPRGLPAITEEIALEQVPGKLAEVLRGENLGRTVVRVGAA